MKALPPGIRQKLSSKSQECNSPVAYALSSDMLTGVGTGKRGKVSGASCWKDRCASSLSSRSEMLASLVDMSLLNHKLKLALCRVLLHDTWNQGLGTRESLGNQGWEWSTDIWCWHTKSYVIDLRTRMNHLSQCISISFRRKVLWFGRWTKYSLSVVVCPFH